MECPEIQETFIVWTNKRTLLTKVMKLKQDQKFSSKLIQDGKYANKTRTRTRERGKRNTHQESANPIREISFGRK